MSLAIIFTIILVILFVSAYVSKRRFGALGLSLAAGSILSGFWTDFVVDQARSNGVTIASPLLVSLVATALVLSPAILLLLKGPIYTSKPKRIIGALLFASLAIAFLIEPLQPILVLQGYVLSIYTFFSNNQIYIITTGIIVAVVDLLLTKTPKDLKFKSKH